MENFEDEAKHESAVRSIQKMVDAEKVLGDKIKIAQKKIDFKQIFTKIPTPECIFNPNPPIVLPEKKPETG